LISAGLGEDFAGGAGDETLAPEFDSFSTNRLFEAGCSAPAFQNALIAERSHAVATKAIARTRPVPATRTSAHSRPHCYQMVVRFEDERSFLLTLGLRN